MGVHEGPPDCSLLSNYASSTQGIIKSHLQRLEDRAIVPKGWTKKHRQINLDEGMLITLPIWEISLEMHLFRRSWAIKKMHKGIKRFLKTRRLEKLQKRKSMRERQQQHINVAGLRKFPRLRVIRSLWGRFARRPKFLRFPYSP